MHVFMHSQPLVAIVLVCGLLVTQSAAEQRNLHIEDVVGDHRGVLPSSWIDANAHPAILDIVSADLAYHYCSSVASSRGDVSPMNVTVVFESRADAGSEDGHGDGAGPSALDVAMLHVYFVSSVCGSWRVEDKKGGNSHLLGNPGVMLDDRYRWRAALTASRGGASLWMSHNAPLASSISVRLSAPNTIALSLDMPCVVLEEDGFSLLLMVGGAEGAAVSDRTQQQQQQEEHSSLSATSVGFLPFDKEPSDVAFGGGDNSDTDPNIVDLLLPNSDEVQESFCTQNDMLFRYCAPQGLVARVVPYTGHCQATWGASDNTVAEEGGNACWNAEARCAAVSRYALQRNSQWMDESKAFSGVLQLQHSNDASFGRDIERLKVVGSAWKGDVCRLEIFDAAGERWRTPHVLVQDEDDQVDVAASNCGFLSSADDEVFGVKVQWKDTQLFDSHPPSLSSSSSSSSSSFSSSSHHNFRDLVFKDKYLEWSTRMPEGYKAYGLGERVSALSLPTSGVTYSFSALDHFTPYMENLYGVHPMMMVLQEDGTAFGVFLNNNHGMEITLFPTKAVFQVMGGVLDFFFFPGPTPMEVVQQYQAVVGRPAMPPYWALGFHQCRWGYRSSEELMEVVDQFDAHELPLDVLWSDIDYMENKKLFTLDQAHFPAAEMRRLVESLHDDGRRYVVIVDPGVRIESDYGSFERGLRDNVFINDPSGTTPVVGKVWPGLVHFVDWAHPNASLYWAAEVQRFHDAVAFDGLWIDMNEIANFCDGHCLMDTRLADDVAELFTCPCAADVYGAQDSESVLLDFPPFWAGNRPPDVSTISMASKHYGNKTEYDYHSLYGHMESIATQRALQQLTQQRTLVITRSSFAGSGHHVGHWLGDNSASWFDLQRSIAGVLTMNILGVPLVGADICGFSGNTTEELCARWMTLGAFYPFSRNHNELNANSQEPYALGDTVLEASQNALRMRYQLLPYLYSLFYKTHLHGGAVALPLFFLAPQDPSLAAIDDQFLLGEGLMVAPVVVEGAMARNVLFPAGNWYDFSSGRLVSAEPSDTQTLHFDVALTEILVFQRQGSIIPTQESGRNTAEARTTPFSLRVALRSFHDKQIDHASLYLDDGTTLEVEHHSLVQFSAGRHNHTHGYVLAVVSRKNFTSRGVWKELRICQVCASIMKERVTVFLDHTKLSSRQWSLDMQSGCLTVDLQSARIMDGFRVSWAVQEEPPSQSDDTTAVIILLSAMLVGAAVILTAALVWRAIAIYKIIRQDRLHYKKTPQEAVDGEEGAEEIGIEMEELHEAEEGEGEGEEEGEGEGTIAAKDVGREKPEQETA